MGAPRKGLPKKTSGFRVTLDDDLAVQLEAYLRATEEPSDRLPVVRRAIREYLATRLKDKKLRARFEQERHHVLAKLPAGLRLVASRERAKGKPK
jgi:hypothetical protein